jgi:hypothetical protein
MSPSNINLLQTNFVPNSSNPRAVAIVLGHLGASPRTLAKYGSYYTSRDCRVITAASPPWRFMLNLHLRRTAQEIVQQAAKALQEAPPNTPLLIHSFSNGGAFLLEEMESIFREDKDSIMATGSSTSSDPDVQLVATRLGKGTQIFDSCPCYIRLLWDTKHSSKSFPDPAWSPLFRKFYTLGASVALTLWCTLTLSWHRPRAFWLTMKELPCRHDIYVFSTKDSASDASAVERLITERQSAGVECLVHRFEDSGHCRIDHDHPQDYQKMIDEAIEAAINRSIASDRPA